MFGIETEPSLTAEQLQAFAASFEAEDGSGDKRPPNAFILFLRTYRPAVAQNNPSLTPQEVERLIGKMWQSTEDATRNEFREHAKQYADLFKNLHPDYVEPTRKRKPSIQIGRVPEPIKIRVILHPSEPETSPVHDDPLAVLKSTGVEKAQVVDFD